MATWEYTVWLFMLIALFVGVVIWAFGRKRKKRFEQDSRIPFDDE
ncbi:cbb3-type cytochrome oxidase subunit 3 [Dechloromonas sp. A34]|nr:cbb3-type cytochrome c oxidase subunit 3 [Dechloromonas sp. A34]